MMNRFDTFALFQALDRKRLERGMTWNQVAAEMHVSASTVRRTAKGGRMEVDGMLAMVSWLGVSVETFVIKTRH